MRHAKPFFWTTVLIFSAASVSQGTDTAPLRRVAHDELAQTCKDLGLSVPTSATLEEAAYVRAVNVLGNDVRTFGALEDVRAAKVATDEMKALQDEDRELRRKIGRAGGTARGASTLLSDQISGAPPNGRASGFRATDFTPSERATLSTLDS